MSSLIRSLFGRVPGDRRNSGRQSRQVDSQSRAALRPMESLEPRAMLSANVDDSGLLTIVGTERADVIEVRPGPVAGSVSLRGVAGVARDTVFNDVARVSISSLGGNDRILVAPGIRDVSNNPIEFTIDSGNGNDVVDGGDGRDTIRTQAGNDTVRGHGGNDDINLGIGNDFGDGGSGDDTINGDRGSDRVWGGSGNDSLDGGGENDVVRGQDGDDTLVGGFGSDNLFGGNGNDSGAGDFGNDNIFGEAGDDRLTGGSGRDQIRGGDGDDSLDGGDDSDDLFGEAGDDSINGGRGRDRIRGGIGSNSSLDDDGDNDLDLLNRGAIVQFVEGSATVSGTSASKDDKKFYTFRAPEGATTLSVVLQPGDGGVYADLEIERFVGDLTLVELEPSEGGPSSASGLAIVAGQVYKLRLRAPDRSPVGFSVTMTVA